MCAGELQHWLGNAIQTGGTPTAHQICSACCRRSLGVHPHDHHHGHFVGLTCQVQAQEITQEVILCKYSRQARFRPRPPLISLTGYGLVSGLCFVGFDTSAILVVSASRLLRCYILSVIAIYAIVAV